MVLIFNPGGGAISDPNSKLFVMVLIFNPGGRHILFDLDLSILSNSSVCCSILFSSCNGNVIIGHFGANIKGKGGKFLLI